MKKAFIFSALLAGTGTIFANPPNVFNVTLAQPEGTHLAVVEYETDGTGIVTFQFMTNGVNVCHSEVVRTVTGDINRLLPAGAYRFTWDAGRDFPEQLLPNLTVAVTLWVAENPPPFCAVNLVETDGAYVVRWYGKETEVPFGVNHSWWKKDWLLLRKMPPSGGLSTLLGSPPLEIGRDNTREIQRNVRMTKPFYMGVFQVTQRQWQMIYGDRPSYFNNVDCYEERPVEQVSFNTIRGSAEDGCNWPNDGHAVDPASFMGLLRKRTGGMIEFDLPTEAQWEYACRAGTTGAWNNGTTIMDSIVDPNLDLLGRYDRNGGRVFNGESWVTPGRAATLENGTAAVGSYLPNAWGLYDMHGNVWEHTLDWFVSSGGTASLAGDDPKGPVSGTSRTDRGGGWYYAATDARAARRGSASPVSTSSYLGFRIVSSAEVLISQ